MAAEIATALIAASGAIVLAGATYWFTKKREREAELRKEKLAHYKEFTICLSGVVSGGTSQEDHRAFAHACNKLNLVAPQSVVAALQAFQKQVRITNKNPNKEVYDRCMSDLFIEMRKDLGVTPADRDSNFVFGLWSS